VGFFALFFSKIAIFSLIPNNLHLKPFSILKVLISIHHQNPEPRKIQEVVSCLQDGGIIIYPTDTVYGIGCDIFNPKAVERVCQLKGIEPAKSMLSFVCNDLSHLSRYTRHFERTVYRLMKMNLPGAFTFILPASNEVPKMFVSKRKTVGIRVPKHPVPQAIVTLLERPLLSASLPMNQSDAQYYTDPSEIYEQFGKLVDMVIDSGRGDVQPSTVVDCSDGEGWEVLRQGKGELVF
jgi:tRNA threonylcarbamoyl adenosine modification protein (Sua5/YciO/YrdC/YwlC family)